MALPGITCPEKFIVPLYFQQDKGEFSRLFQKDSIFEHLFDPWKQETVKAISNEDISLLKYLHSHYLALKSPLFASLKQSKDRNSELIKQIVSSDNIYYNMLHENFIQNINVLDNDLMVSTLKYYAILEEHKRLSHIKYEHIKAAIALKQEIEKISRRIIELSCILHYETFGSIKITTVDSNNPQFIRCDKAICDNIRSQYFTDSVFSSIKLCRAYKIEHSSLLKDFEKKMKNSENAMLKGLFMSISKEHIPGIVVFGFQNKDFIKNQSISDYYTKYCRLPSELIGKTRIDEFIEASKGFKNEVVMSSNSTLSSDEEKIRDNNNCVILLLLSRVIVPRTKNEANQKYIEYKISDLSSIYPEYILVCTKVKNYFEIVPQLNFIIPVKLVDLNYSSQASNKMGVDVFYSYYNRAIEQSDLQRSKIKNEISSAIDGFWNNGNKKDTVFNSLMESKKIFAERIKIQIEGLKKELAAQQRYTESLKNIKSIRFKTT